MFLSDGSKFYTFGLAAVSWAIWNCRHRATFEFKFPSTPFEVAFSSCVFLNYWAGHPQKKYWACLMKNGDQDAMRRGPLMLKYSANSMMRICGAAHEDAATN